MSTCTTCWWRLSRKFPCGYLIWPISINIRSRSQRGTSELYLKVRGKFQLFILYYYLSYDLYCSGSRLIGRLGSRHSVPFIRFSRLTEVNHTIRNEFVSKTSSRLPRYPVYPSPITRLPLYCYLVHEGVAIADRISSFSQAAEWTSGITKSLTRLRACLVCMGFPLPPGTLANSVGDIRTQGEARETRPLLGNLVTPLNSQSSTTARGLRATCLTPVTILLSGGTRQWMCSVVRNQLSGTLRSVAAELA